MLDFSRLSVVHDNTSTGARQFSCLQVAFEYITSGVFAFACDWLVAIFSCSIYSVECYNSLVSELVYGSLNKLTMTVYGRV